MIECFAMWQAPLYIWLLDICIVEFNEIEWFTIIASKGIFYEKDNLPLDARVSKIVSGRPRDKLFQGSC